MCGEPQLRLDWGCDAPRSEPVFQIACECGGAKRDCQSDDCDDGWRPLYRCPFALIRENGPALGLSDFLYSWGVWREHGVLPGPGSFDDQPAAWVQACYIADQERSAWDRAHHDRMREMRERSVTGGRNKA